MQRLEKQLSASESDKTKLKSKLKSREQEWLDRMKELRHDYETLVVDYEALDKILAAYKEQYTAIQQLAPKGEIEPSEQPYGFAVLYTRLDQKLVAANHALDLLKRENAQLLETVHQQTRLVDGNSAQNDALSKEQMELKLKLDRSQSFQDTLQARVNKLELELEAATNTRLEAQTKLKKIVNAYQSLFK